MGLLTVNDLCKKLNCKKSYVYRLVNERRIAYLKLGHRQLRFDEREINDFLAKCSHASHQHDHEYDP